MFLMCTKECIGFYVDLNLFINNNVDISYYAL